MIPRFRCVVSGRISLLIALVVTSALIVTSAPVRAASAANHGGGANPGFYENPLEPEIPGDGIVESCADPVVIRGQQPNDDNWYMYCTTDPLNDEDLDAGGNLIFHRIPMMTSQDLVNWTYVADAFPSGTAGLPEWADPTAALWAPDIVYSTEFDQYYLFFVVTNTTAAVSGVEGCGGDSAIGVATSETPTGPWEFSAEPVVAPRQNGAGCNFFWTFDPDVLGDAVGTESILYYGSYYGGIFGTELTLTTDGAVVDATTTVPITIDNRYEGANVIFRDGFYYLFVSATNCCAGALTGYSVFVGRSDSPLGPFVDQQGHSLFDAQVGGTPLLTMNGNRWVGTGHNTVFQDANGDWWTIYHAVDQEDPFFETAVGFTKRPALLDAIDWINGWPTVNGGAGPSDTRMPAPAGQTGEVSRHKMRLVKTQLPSRLLDSDEFAGTALDSEWSWIRADAATYAVQDGVLTMNIQKADLHVDNNTASVLVRDAPDGDFVVETRVRVTVPEEGCCFNYAQAGVVIYGDDNNYIKLTNTSIWNTRQSEFAKEVFPVPQGWRRYGNTVGGAVSPEWTYLRIVVERLSGVESTAAGGDTHSYTAYTSTDGVNWVRGGTWTHTLGQDGQIGLVAMGLDPNSPDQFSAEFDYVRVSALKESAAVEAGR